MQHTRISRSCFKAMCSLKMRILAYPHSRKFPNLKRKENWPNTRWKWTSTQGESKREGCFWDSHLVKCPETGCWWLQAVQVGCRQGRGEQSKELCWEPSAQPLTVFKLSFTLR